jgi:hypothetical protein
MLTTCSPRTRQSTGWSDSVWNLAGSWSATHFKYGHALARPYTPLKMENNQSTGFFKVIFVLKLNNNRYTKPQTKGIRASNQSY